VTFIVVVSVAALALIGLVLALPCAACRRRRERLAAAYALWRSRKVNAPEP
jgi:hypothetical protein